MGFADHRGDALGVGLASRQRATSAARRSSPLFPPQAPIAYITQLHAADPGSFGFRYPLAKASMPSVCSEAGGYAGCGLCSRRVTPTYGPKESSKISKVSLKTLVDQDNLGAFEKGWETPNGIPSQLMASLLPGTEGYALKPKGRLVLLLLVLVDEVQCLVSKH